VPGTRLASVENGLIGLPTPIFEPLQDFKINQVQCMEVGALQHYKRCGIRLECFDPSQCAQAPLVARFQPGKSPFWHRRAQVIAPAAAEFQEAFGHHHAYQMLSGIFLIGLAATVPEKAGYRVEGARNQGLIEYVSGGRQVDFIHIDSINLGLASADRERAAPAIYL
jgi:hypothetical protein